MRVGILGWLGSNNTSGMKALSHIQRHHDARGRIVEFVRPTSTNEVLTMFGHRKLRNGTKLKKVEMLHVFSAGSIVLWNLREQLDDTTMVVLDSPALPSSLMTANLISKRMRLPISGRPLIANALQAMWDIDGFGDLYGCSSSDMRSVYRKFMNDLIGNRPTFIIRGHLDHFTDVDSVAVSVISECGCPIKYFHSSHIKHIHTHPDAYDESVCRWYREAVLRP
jgi:hypothetical protein